MYLFKKKPEPPKPPDRLPEPTFTVKSIRRAWWSVFTNSLDCSIEDAESLLRVGRNSEEYARAARNIADAAISEFEDRWGGPANGDSTAPSTQPEAKESGERDAKEGGE